MELADKFKLYLIQNMRIINNQVWIVKERKPITLFGKTKVELSLMNKNGYTTTIYEDILSEVEEREKINKLLSLVK